MRTAVQRWLAVGLAVFVAGIVRDLQWHATHDTQREFDNATRQVAVHLILWVGVVVVLAATVRGALVSTTGRRGQYLVFLLVAGLAYVAVSVWHFIEHAQGADPAIAHVLLYLSTAALVVGCLLAVVRTPSQPTA